MLIVMLMRDRHLFESVKKTFEEDGVFTCQRFVDETSLLGFLAREEAALVVLDSGREFSTLNAVLAWRNCHCLDAIRIIVIGHFLGKACMMAAFDAGADDILVGDLSAEELLVRVKQVLKRSALEAQFGSGIEIGPFILDRSATVALLHGRTIRLTSREFAIAWLFFSNPGKLLTRSQIARTIWGKDVSIVGRTLEQHVYKLRSKLQLGDSSNFIQLTTVYSLGYKLETPPMAQAGRNRRP